VRGGAGTTGVRDRRQILVAVMHPLLFGLVWRQIGVQHLPPSEVGCFWLHAGIDREGSGTLLSGQLDPGSHAPCCGAGHALLHRPLSLGAWMGCEVLLGRGALRLERGQLRVPGGPHCLGTHRLTPQHVAAPRSRAHLGPLVIQEVHVQGPGAPQFFHLGFGTGGNVRAPVLRERCAGLALDHASVANQGDGCDAQPWP
jgi:hypothetical protein